MIFEIIRGGGKTDWVGKDWAGLLFPRGKNGPAHSFPGEKTVLGGNSGLLHRYWSKWKLFSICTCINFGLAKIFMKTYTCI